MFAALSATVAAQPTPGSITTHPLALGGGASTIDTAGSVYVTASSNNASAVSPGAAQTQLGGGSCDTPLPFGVAYRPCFDAFIIKYDSSGNKVFATLLGGPTSDFGVAGTVDPAGNVYVTGTTGGSFPTTPNSAIAVSTTSTTFAAKLSADGSAFLYSTYLPDSLATPSAIGVDPQGNAIIVGQTASNHVFIVKLSADGSTVVYTKTLAGANQDSPTAVATDASGNVYVAGYTASPGFPVSAGVVQPQLSGVQNAFIAKLDPNGNIVFSTFLGGSGQDQATDVTVDAQGAVYVAGSATSLDFPTTPGSFQPAPLVPAWSTTPGGFAAKLSADARSIDYATYMPSGSRLALGASGDMYLGAGDGPGFPVTDSAPNPCLPGNFDVSGGSVIAHLDANGKLLDATYVIEDGVQAIALASDSSVLLAGQQLSRIRFGDPGWIAPPCMTLTLFNSARLSTAYASPGEFISLLGFGIGPETGSGAQAGPNGTPLTLGGVQVLFDGIPAPVVYAQSRQVNAQAPFELAGQTSTVVTLQYNGATFGPVTVPVRFGDPGLFRLQPNVSAQAYAVNQDGTINGPSNPAARGSIVALWGTGFGSVDPGCSTGGLNAPGPVNLASGLGVTIGGGGAIQYAGGAPTLACGIVQINMQVPLDGPSGARALNPMSVWNQPNGMVSFVDGATGGSLIYIQ